MSKERTISSIHLNTESNASSIILYSSEFSFSSLLALGMLRDVLTTRRPSLCKVEGQARVGVPCPCCQIIVMS